MSPDRNPLAVRFGNNLRACRRRAGISQEALGMLTSLHRTEIGMLERGVREPRLGTILKLAGALSVSVEELLAGMTWKCGGVRPLGSFEFADLGGGESKAADHGW